MATRVIIIEDDETWKFLHRAQLRDARDVIIVAEFERAEEALQQIPQYVPMLRLSILPCRACPAWSLPKECWNILP